jgi:hypothetical protein
MDLVPVSTNPDSIKARKGNRKHKLVVASSPTRSNKATRSNPQDVQALTSNMVENIRWTQGFDYPDMVRIAVPGDGHCFFHALCLSFSREYKTGVIDGRAIDRQTFVINLRRDLAKLLTDKVDPLDRESLTYYEQLSRGSLKEFGDNVPEYKLSNMIRELQSSQSVDYVYYELISDQIDKDIYVLNLITQDVYVMGDASDLYIKNRASVVLLYMPGHYELIGLVDEDRIKTLFPYDHPFITAIRTRIREVSPQE